MRISVMPGDPGYTVDLMKEPNIQIALDGEVLMDCLMADEELGVVVLLKLNNHGRVTIREMRGEVKITFPPEPNQDAVDLPRLENGKLKL